VRKPLFAHLAAKVSYRASFAVATHDNYVATTTDSRGIGTELSTTRRRPRIAKPRTANRGRRRTKNREWEGAQVNEVMARIREFTAEHPDVTITPPTEQSKLWEARSTYGISQWDDPLWMLTELETWHRAA
jgi:hypothetical protein